MNESPVKKLADGIELANANVEIFLEEFEAFSTEVLWLSEKLGDYQFRDKQEGRNTLLGMFSNENVIKMKNLSNVGKFLIQKLETTSKELNQLLEEAKEEARNGQK